MGSKRNILDFVVDAIDEVRLTDGQRLYDIFGGSAVVGGSFRTKMPVSCNDIQCYTSILAGTYLKNYDWNLFEPNVLDNIVDEATHKTLEFKEKYADFEFKYNPSISFEDIVKLEEKQRLLLDFTFNGLEHLFVKNYSGTYWSYEQCLWIDALSSVAQNDKYKDTFLYNVILSSLMFAMSYCTQSTGHYAQYRDITKSNLKDILFYRQKEILTLFKQKFISLREFYNGTNNSNYKHQFSTKHYTDLLDSIEYESIVYADPPYQFVHYSRFYHAIETLVKYDYPLVEHKGRYRSDRHQSPFCIKSKVNKAFTNIFDKVNQHRSTLVLSYSDTGMISLEELMALSKKSFKSYIISNKEMDHKHSTMGRQKDKSRDVKESLLICKPIKN